MKALTTEIGKRYLSPKGIPVVVEEIKKDKIGLVTNVIVMDQVTGNKVSLGPQHEFLPFDPAKMDKLSKEKLAAKKALDGTPKKTGHALSDQYQRLFKGKTVTIQQKNGVFSWNGRTFASLTAAAKAITGYKAVSGPVFFGVKK